MPVGKFIRDLAQFADRMHVHLALRAGANGPYFVAAFGDMVQYAGSRPVMPIPIAVVLSQQRVHMRKRIWNAVFVRSAR